MKGIIISFFMTITLFSNTIFTRDNNIVIDNNFNMIWQDNIQAKTTKLEFNKALEYCQTLSLQGHSKWRLPTYEELLSIGNQDEYKPIINKIFKYSASGHYWSIIYKELPTGNYWTKKNIIEIRRIYFSDGYSYDNDRTGKAYVRCIKPK